MPSGEEYPRHRKEYDKYKERQKEKQEMEDAQSNSDNLDNPSFWEQFVTEWRDAKENIRLNDEFMKQQLNPAFDTYQQRLSGLSQDPAFSPIGVQMGDFSTSFMPRRAAQNAQDILKSEMTRSELMQPKSAEMSYLDRLQPIAQWKKDYDLRKKAVKKGIPSGGDSGTFMDSLTDLIGLGTGASKLFKMWG